MREIVIAHLERAVEHHRLALQSAPGESRNCGYEAEAFQALGDDLHVSGDLDAARELWTRALTVLSDSTVHAPTPCVPAV